MTRPSFTVFGETYAEASAPGLPQGTIFLNIQTSPQLVELYNRIASNLGEARVRRFADHTKAVSRTLAMLQRYAATPDYTLASDPGAKGDDFEMSDAERAAQKGRHEPAAQLSATDRAQIADEAASRRPPPRSEQLLDAAAAAGARAQAQAALRTSPPASDNPAKDAEMPALRRAVKVTELAPKKKVYARKAGSKQAVLVDLLSRPQGATFGELYDGLAATGKPWRGVTIRSGLAWDINHIAGYGVTSELLNGEQFAEQGRAYEANRLGVLVMPPADIKLGDGYDPELKLAVYRLTYPSGMDAPLPHIAKKA